MNNSLTALALGRLNAIKSDKMLVINVPGESTPTIVKPEDLEKLYIETRVELNNTKLELEKLKKEVANGEQEKTNKSGKRQKKLQSKSEVEGLQKKEV